MAIKRMDPFAHYQHTIRIHVPTCVCVMSHCAHQRCVLHVNKVLPFALMALVARLALPTLFLHVLVPVHLPCKETFIHAEIHKQWTFPISMHLKKILKQSNPVHPIWALQASLNGSPIHTRSCGEIARPQIMELSISMSLFLLPSMSFMVHVSCLWWVGLSINVFEKRSVIVV